MAPRIAFQRPSAAQDNNKKKKQASRTSKPSVRASLEGSSFVCLRYECALVDQLRICRDVDA